MSDISDADMADLITEGLDMSRIVVDRITADKIVSGAVDLSRVERNPHFPWLLRLRPDPAPGSQPTSRAAEGSRSRSQARLMRSRPSGLSLSRSRRRPAGSDHGPAGRPQRRVVAGWIGSRPAADGVTSDSPRAGGYGDHHPTERGDCS